MRGGLRMRVRGTRLIGTRPERALPGPPWLKRNEWRAANATVSFLLHRYRHQAADLKRSAAQLKARVHSIFPDLDEMCAMSCAWCPEPCCLGARIWWDLRDLLFLHLNRREMAARQPIGHDEHPCRYLGPRGCRLDRLDRPWICTWYLCPPQKAYLGQTAPRRLAAVQAQIAAIQNGRKRLENDFIRLTAGIGIPS